MSRQFKLVGFQVQIFQRLVMQLQADNSVQTLNLLDPGLMPYTQINGSTYPAPDPAIVSATPPVSSPDYSTAITTFTQQVAPNTFEGQPVNFYQTFSTTVSCEDAFPNEPCQENLLPGLNLQIWGAPTSNPTYDPTNRNFIYQRFQRSIMHYDAGCQCTQGLLLADYFKAIITGQNLPLDLDVEARGSIYYKQYDPSKPMSIARPSQLPDSDLTNAFVQQQPGAAANPSPAPAPGGPPATPVNTSGWAASACTCGISISKPSGHRRTSGKPVQLDESQVGMDIELAPGQYDWTQLDEIVNAATRPA
jgi:hypothetical protein